MKVSSLLVLGYFGYVNDQIDGQTLKTRSVYNLSKKVFNNVAYFDTQQLKVNRLSLFRMLSLVLFSKNIIILPGKNNLTKFFSILSYARQLFGKNLYVFAVGGWLSEYLTENKLIEKRFKKVKHVFVESKALKSRLEKNNALKNFQISVFPNFRESEYQPTFINHPTRFSLVFIARITKEKGCDRVFDFLEFYERNKSLFHKDIKVNFYGPIDPSYRLRFMKQLKKFSRIAFYHGVISAKQVCDVVGENDVTVLPTSYEGEGFPGTIVDSYMAGVPVITSRWKDLPEFVEEGKTGFVFDLDRPSDFYKHIVKLANDDALLLMMKRYAFEQSSCYSIEKAEIIIKDVFDNYEN